MKLTKHHLIPLTRHKNKKIKARFSKDQLNEVIHICRQCHNQIHALISEKEMADTYFSLEVLLQHEGVQRFTEWVRKRQPESRIRVLKKR